MNKKTSTVPLTGMVIKKIGIKLPLKCNGSLSMLQQQFINLLIGEKNEKK